METRLQGHVADFLHGLTNGGRAAVLAGLERRRFAPGAIVLTEGDVPRELYIVASGSADVFITDRHGQEHWLNQIGPGSTLGEMALFTGRPVSATVRAREPFDVLVMSEDQFHRAAEHFPRLYRNLGTILSERLVSTNRRTVSDEPFRLTLLADHGAPPLLAYALAASVAWHTRAATLLVAVAHGSPPDDLAAIARRRAVDDPASQGADVVCVTPSDAFANGLLTPELETRCHAASHVLISAPDESFSPALLAQASRHLPMQGSNGALPTSAYAIRAWDDGGTRHGPDHAGVLRVPALGNEDAAAMRQGMLPARTPAGRAIGWAARDIAGRKVGLALGAGSTKGYAHVGVLRALAGLGLEIDYLAGTSIGASIAALRALDYTPDAMATTLDRLGAAAFQPTVPMTSVLSSRRLGAQMRQIGGETRFEDLRLPLAVVAADILTREEVVFSKGLVWPAVLASMSIPGVFPPQRIEGRTLVDGGVINPVPANVTAEMGADTLIAVKLASRSPVPEVAAGRRSPSIVDVITRSIEIMQSYIVTDTAEAATILIEPAFGEISGFGLRRFSQGRRFIDLGEMAVEAALPRLSSALPWLRPSPER